jgi:hypothetical protein
MRSYVMASYQLIVEKKKNRKYSIKIKKIRPDNT